MTTTTQILNPSFRIDWQVNTNEITETIFKILETIAAPIRPKSIGHNRQQNRSGRRRSKGRAASPPIENDEPRLIVEPSTSEPAESIEDKERSTIFKRHAVLGISKILRLLESNSLSIVLFDRSFLRPSAIAQFIGAACIESKAHCTCLDGLSSRIASILNVNSASVIGIKKSDNNDDERIPESIGSLVDAVRTLTKPVSYVSDWIETEEDGGGGSKKRKNRRSRRSEAGIDQSDKTAYVETSVLVQQHRKKKKK